MAIGPLTQADIDSRKEPRERGLIARLAARAGLINSKRYPDLFQRMRDAKEREVAQCLRRSW